MSPVRLGIALFFVVAVTAPVAGDPAPTGSQKRTDEPVLYKEKDTRLFQAEMTEQQYQLAERQFVVTTALTVANVFLFLMSVTISLIVLRGQRRDKSLETVQLFNERFAALLGNRIGGRGGLAVEEFLERFWGIQFEQFLFWERGLIPNDFFAMWMVSRRLNFHSGFGPAISAAAFGTSFADTRQKYTYFPDAKRFFDFIEGISKVSLANPASDIEALVKRYPKRG